MKLEKSFEKLEYSKALESDKEALQWLTKNNNKFGQFVGGEFISKKDAETITVVNPADNSTLAHIEIADKKLVDLAVKSAVRAAFACAGQWCTSTSRAIVVKEISEEFSARVVKEAGSLITGNGMLPETNMGPVCGTDQLRNILKYIQCGRDEGAVLLVGGQRLSGKDYNDGCFIAPTVFGNVNPAMTIAREEIFGPVLSIITVNSFEEAMRVANDSTFGLCSSIFTNDLSRAMTFIAATEVGLTHVNMMSAYKEPQLPFGGIKESGIGLPEAGTTGIEFFTNNKSVYIKH